MVDVSFTFSDFAFEDGSLRDVHIHLGKYGGMEIEIWRVVQGEMPPVVAREKVVLSKREAKALAMSILANIEFIDEANNPIEGS